MVKTTPAVTWREPYHCRQGDGGEKKHSGSDAVRTASLPDLRRWPGVGFLDRKAKSEFRPRWESEVGIPTLVGERSRNSGGAARSKTRVGQIRLALIDALLQ